MFASRFHSTNIKLKPNEEVTYRLPPMSAGPILINARNSYFSRGPHDESVAHFEPTDELELELTHSEHLSQSGENRILAESLWHDDLWRLRIRRVSQNGGRDEIDAEGRLGYYIDALYPSQLPILERRIPTSFFQDGFAQNWNRQNYIRVAIIANRIELSFQEDLARLYNLPLHGDPYVIPISPAFVTPDIELISQELSIGAGPLPGGGGNVPFIAFRVRFPATRLEFDITGPNPAVDLTAFFMTIRLYLRADGKFLEYVPVFDTNIDLEFNAVLDLVNVLGGPDEQEVLAKVKQAIENGLYQLQYAGSSPSKFGRVIAPWLVGGPIEVNPLFSINDLTTLTYAPGPGDSLQPNGIVQPATGDIVVRYVGPRPKPSTDPVLFDPTSPPPTPTNDRSIRLFDVPDEDTPALSGGANNPPVGVEPPTPGGRPDIGALAKIDHIVILMQENRSFDQVLGYLSREKINPKVDGLLPPDDANHDKQVNFFKGVPFLPQLADAAEPPRIRATAWPLFTGVNGTIVSGPCHDTSCVRSQMDNMGGFVSDFADRVGEPPPNAAVNPNLRLVMDYFNGEQLKFYDLLASEFSICDRWYTTHPGPTWPNRFVLLTGDLNKDSLGNVELDNTDVKNLVPVQTPTLFDILNDLGVSWRIFEHGLSFARVFKNLTFDITNILPFDDPTSGFEASARNGSLPQVTFIEPDYIDLPPGNDDHPPADMCGGQVLVERIVKALVDSPTWDKTLFIITYDEHGGFYDHRQPPTVPAAQALRGGGVTLGPRVPTFFVSPLIPRGEVFFGRDDTGRFFEHTSIGATILRRFSGNHRPPHISPRLDAARDLREVLTLDIPRPRSDFDRIRQYTRDPACASETRTRDARTRTIGAPEGNEDFHWTMAAVRLLIGDPPKSSSPKPPPAGGDPCQPQVDAVIAAQSAVNTIDGQIKSTQAALRVAPPSEKPFLRSEIARLRQERPVATKALDAVRRTLKSCRDKNP